MSESKCSFCGSKNLDVILSFGEVALAGAFIKSNQTTWLSKSRKRCCISRNALLSHRLQACLHLTADLWLNLTKFRNAFSLA